MTFLIAATGILTKAILVVLVGLSVWSIAVMIERGRALKELEAGADLSTARTLIKEHKWKELKEWASENRHSLHRTALLAATGAQGNDQIDRVVRSYLNDQKPLLEKGLTVLATLGANAPFIGLFGTVLGIIQAFGVLATNPSGSAGVMSSLAEALVATAVGLFVAIPAVVAYNYFAQRIRTLLMSCDSLKDLYISQLET